MCICANDLNPSVVNMNEGRKERTRKRTNKRLHKRIKVAYTSGPIFETIMKRYPIFSVQIIHYQIDQKHK